MELRPYQITARDRILDTYESGAKSVCLVMPTGSGKTCTFSDIAARCFQSGTRTVIIVHRDTLLLQASRKLTECGVIHGIIAPGLPRTRDLIQVASIQTLIRRDNAWDFIIVDEAHHALAASYLKIVERNPDAHILGVTATPIRTNGAGLNAVFERLICGPSIHELITDGFLVSPKVYGPTQKLDLTGLRTRAGDYDQSQLAITMDKPTITGDAVREYTKLCPGVPALVFTVSVQHAIDVSAEFNQAGYRAEYVHGGMNVHNIRDNIAGLADGRIQILASCDLISEGFDCPAIQAAILLRPTKSVGLYMQQVGRALRPYPGKTHALILDHAASFLTHGMPDDDREWTLDGRKKKPFVPIVRQCPKCFAVHKPEPRCPACGFVYPIAERSRDIEYVPGELSEIDASALRVKKWKMITAARTYQELKAVGKKLGYRPGWAYHTAVRRGIKIYANRS
jgi:DNA repair protein RadD